MGYDARRFVGEVDLELQCSICAMVFKNPIETPCDHAFCNECITSWLVSNNTCPLDCAPLSVTQLKRPGRVFRNLLAKMKIRCDLDGCDTVVELEHLEHHITNCQCNPDSEVTCEGGCNRTLRRCEQQTHNCLGHLSNLLGQQDDEVTKLSEVCRKLMREIENLRLIVGTVSQQLENIQKIGEISCIPLNTKLKWRICKQLRYCDQSNILEYNDAAAYPLRSSAQSYYPLSTGIPFFKVEVLSVAGNMFLGLAPRCDTDGEMLVLPLNFHVRFNEKNFQVGDVIECGIENPQNLSINERVEIVVYFSKNGKIVLEKSVRMHPAHLFPTITLASYINNGSMRVKILNN